MENDDELLSEVVPEEPATKPIRVDVSRFLEHMESERTFPAVLRGHVRATSGNIITARLPNSRIGELCSIEPRGRPAIKAQVVGFNDEDVFLTALDPVSHVGPQTPIVNRGETLSVPVGHNLLGRVVDSLAEPIDNGGPLRRNICYPLLQQAPLALDRKRITKPLTVGIRSIDLLNTFGEGQRLGVFSAAGVGKSSLLGMIARNSAADVNVVALVGERGREVNDFLEDSLGEEGLEKSVVVVSTSDDTPLRRITAAYTATAIAEYFRDHGNRVMLLMDSVTRFARAQREIALSLGEAPVRQGFPPSVLAALPALFERAGNTEEGSITAIYTVLLGSEQIEDPLGDEIRALLDGHIYLHSRLSQSQHFPAVDMLLSNSRLMGKITSQDHQHLAEHMRRLWAAYEEHRDLITLGAYRVGSDPLVDEAIEKRDAIRKFLVQAQTETSSLEQTLEFAKRTLKHSDRKTELAR